MKNKFDLQNLSVKDFLFLNKLLTPVFITFFYWLTLLLVLISGLSIVFTSFTLFSFSFKLAFFTFFSGIITIIVGILTTRVVFELICVLLNINRNIEKLSSTKTDASEATDDLTSHDEN
ncbi:hypothetical protein A9G11_12920 [Gilliamella sp. wkB108]|uniref:DUF4282 domain-containing protein n=1 Tax=Gilliamella sp. wkB108 TaxID=3120256 RepID=UPI00080DCD52|nr:DUF4282 domain-containing protein [Gilliamella apicola]OCG27311.1 hypothetical protein A9G11_12920 [Gilliamella apicola]